MGAHKGRDLLIRIDAGDGFVAVAGLRSTRLAFNAETVDVTDADSAGRWRELIDGGLRKASVSGAGIFRDGAAANLLRQAFFAGAAQRLQLAIPGLGMVEGPFQIVALDFTGSHDGAIGFELALESAGPLAVAVP